MRQIKTKQADNFDFDLSLPPKVRAILRDVPGITQRHAAWIAHALGGYRASVRVAATTPDAATVKDHLKRMACAADDLMAMIDMLPVDVRQSVESFKRVECNGQRVAVSMFGNLEAALPMLAERARQRAAQPSPKGRPTNWAETVLLSSVAEALENAGVAPTEAADTALLILYAEGVQVSKDSRTVTDPRRVIREFRRTYPTA